ncbi:hypothetical protein KKF91_07685 [Myxococcota bacterium]|nr:hypothetical protein [Myxococcota bacterium]MBU1430424.1 hypothetical protein [Myxococcota bacterium]MBU1896874.1 hypothetical protein [Myxococcota bacterium]
MRVHAALFLLLSLGARGGGAWAAAPSVVGIYAQDGAPLPGWIVEAFEAGARVEADAALPDEARAIEAAGAALKRGEAAFLNADLRKADEHLQRATDLFLQGAAALDDSEEATRAVLLLIQVRAARGQGRAVGALLERVLLALPGFPGDQRPPPDVIEHIHKARGRLISQLSGRLTLSGRAGEVRLNGTRVGVSPAQIEGLPKAAVRVIWEGEGRREARNVDLRRREHLHFGPAPDRILGALRGASGRGDRAAFWRAATRLHEATGAREGCLARVEGEAVLVFRLDLVEGRALDGQAARGPRRAADWRTLGAFCGAKAGALSPAQVMARLLPRGDGAGATWPTWLTLGAGLGAAGLGVMFTSSAADAASRYNQTGDAMEKSAATSKALYADLSFALSAGLIGAGAYLFWSEAD